MDEDASSGINKQTRFNSLKDYLAGKLDQENNKL